LKKNTRPPRRGFLFLTLSVLALSVGLACEKPKERKAPGSDPESKSAKKAETYVSLSPSITDTLVHLKLGERLVGISDYCTWSKDSPTRVGSAITPSFEKIAHLGPSQIFAPQVAQDQLAPLRKLAQTTSLKWLTLEDMVRATQKLGELTGTRVAANELSEKLRKQLSHSPGAEAPRVLFALDYGDTGSNDTWFIRKNSIHGSVLRAAGGANAIQKEVQGPPKLSPEQLLQADPDMIIVIRSSEPSSEDQANAMQHFKKFAPLRAVKQQRVAVLALPGSLGLGPSVLSVVAPLRGIIERLASEDFPLQ